MVNWHELDFFTSKWLADNLPPNSFDNFVYQDDKYSLNNSYNENEEKYDFEFEFEDLFEFSNTNDNCINNYTDDFYSDYYQSSESEEDDYEYYNYNYN